MIVPVRKLQNADKSIQFLPIFCKLIFVCESASIIKVLETNLDNNLLIFQAKPRK